MKRISLLILPTLIAFGYCTALETDEQIETAFTNIYDHGEWGTDENGNGVSGPGSTVEEALPYMEMLRDFLQEKKIKSVVDVGCGDWQFSRYIDWNGIEYTGYDIVKNVIEENIREFSSSNISFIHANGASVELPYADLLVCKDVLQHLSIAAIKTCISQLDKFKYCLITNDIDPNSLYQNRDITSGGLRTLDLTKSPFNLPGKTFLDYQSGGTCKRVLLIINRKLLFKELYTTSPTKHPN